VACRAAMTASGVVWRSRVTPAAVESRLERGGDEGGGRSAPPRLPQPAPPSLPPSLSSYLPPCQASSWSNAEAPSAPPPAGARIEPAAAASNGR
jgi:hypothetical protein